MIAALGYAGVGKKALGNYILKAPCFNMLRLSVKPQICYINITQSNLAEQANSYLSQRCPTILMITIDYQKPSYDDAFEKIIKKHIEIIGRVELQNICIAFTHFEMSVESKTQYFVAHKTDLKKCYRDKIIRCLNGASKSGKIKCFFFDSLACDQGSDNNREKLIQFIATMIPIETSGCGSLLAKRSLSNSELNEDDNPNPLVKKCYQPHSNETYRQKKRVNCKRIPTRFKDVYNEEIEYYIEEKSSLCSEWQFVKSIKEYNFAEITRITGTNDKFEIEKEETINGVKTVTMKKKIIYTCKKPDHSNIECIEELTQIEETKERILEEPPIYSGETFKIKKTIFADKRISTVEANTIVNGEWKEISKRKSETLPTLIREYSDDWVVEERKEEHDHTYIKECKISHTIMQNPDGNQVDIQEKEKRNKELVTESISSRKYGYQQQQNLYQNKVIYVTKERIVTEDNGQVIEGDWVESERREVTTDPEFVRDMPGSYVEKTLEYKIKQFIFSITRREHYLEKESYKIYRNPDGNEVHAFQKTECLSVGSPEGIIASFWNFSKRILHL